MDPAAARTIAHLDMDAFYVSVELRRRPQLRGRAVIVAGSGPRAVVTTASYEARRFGVGSAMPASRARRLCPDGVYLAPDFPYYRAASREVMALVRSSAPTMELIGLDEAYLDLSEMPAPRAQMRALAREIELSTGLVCSIGIGPNKLVVISPRSVSPATSHGDLRCGQCPRRPLMRRHMARANAARRKRRNGCR